MVSGPVIEKSCSRHLMFVNSTLIKLLKTKFLYPNKSLFFPISCAEELFDIAALCIFLLRVDGRSLGAVLK